MIGKNPIDKTSLGNFMTGTQNTLFSRTTKQCVHLQGQWQRNKLTIVKMPNFFELPVERVRLEMKKCVALCPPGPNVLLLLVKPSDFNEEDHRKLMLYLQFFGEEALKHSLVVMMDAVTAGGPSVNQLIRDCGHRQYQSCFDERGLQELMEEMVSILSQNQGRHLTFKEDAVPKEAPQSSHTPLNLLLCGTGKSSAVGALLGWNSVAADGSANGLQKAEVCGRQVSVVVLPTLLGKAPNTGKKESYRCVSLCEPEGVHALVLVVALEHIADEDLRELEAIRSAFSSKVDGFTMVLFTTETHPSAPALIFQKQSMNFRALIQSCGGRHVILNIKDRQQVQELLRAVDTMSALGSRTFTKDMIPKPQVNMFTRQASVMKAKNYRYQVPPQHHTVEQEVEKTQVVKPHPTPRSQPQPQPQPNPDPLTLITSPTPTPAPNRESLRIVLIGKTGCGKSATANCILGVEHFNSRASSKSVTTVCQKKEGVVGGQPVMVVDTPGLFDTRLSNQEIRRELINCISLLAPGPHVFLLVLPIGRFTEEEKETIELIKSFFGKAAVDFTVLLFTKVDTLKETTLKSYLDDSDELIKNLISECGERYMAFNGTDLQDRGQVKELLRRVEAVVKRNRGGYYTSDMFIEAEEAIVKETQRILKSKQGPIAREVSELERRCTEQVQAKKRAFSELKHRHEQDEADCKRLVHEQEERIRLEQLNSDRAREDRERKEAAKRQELQRRLEEEERKRQELMEEEKKLQNNVEKTASASQMLQTQNVQELRKQHEAAERERKEWWDKKCREDQEKRQQEQARLAQLMDEHERQMRIYERKKEEDRVRREEAEREWMEAQLNYIHKMEEVKKRHEEQARKQAEENNEFKQRYTRDMAAERERYEQEMQQMRKQQDRHNEGIIRQLTRNKAYRKDYDSLKKRQEEEVSNLKSTMCFHNKDELLDVMRELQLQHRNEINHWIGEHVQMAATNGACAIL